MLIDSRTKIMGLIGNPVDHSRSPMIQNHIDTLVNQNIVYLCFKTDPGNLKSTIESLKTLEAKGFNITIPFKSDVIKYLDFFDSDVDKINACNTVKISQSGLFGVNTDIKGFSDAFKYDTGKKFSGKKIVVLGAGGSSKAVVYSLIKEKPVSITVLNRTLHRAEKLCKNFSDIYANTYSGILGSESSDTLHDADIIINTTSVGMHPNVFEDPLDFYDDLTKNQVVYDIIYNPYETKLLQKAKKSDALTSNGLSMLIFQAIMSYEIINEIKICKDDKENIVKYVHNNVFREY